MDPNTIIPQDIYSCFGEYKDLLLVLAGGLCATFGGLVGTWYKARKARKIKREETIGYQQVEAYKKALRLADKLKSILIQGVEDDVLEFIKSHNSWVLDNEILLPPKFCKYWHSVRANVRSVKRKKQIEKMEDGQERDKKTEELDDLEAFIDKLADDAEKEIRKELKLPPIKIHRPPRRKKK